MKTRFITPYLLALGMLFLTILVAACSLSENNALPQAQAQEQLTQAALEATAHSIASTQTQLALPTSTPPPTSTPEPTATSTLTATPAFTATPVPTNTPAGPLIVQDDFSEDRGNFKCDHCTVKNGQLYMGPWPSADTFAGYYALCKTCGSPSKYKIAVDAVYVSGASDRGFGLVLRESNGAYVDLEITTWQVYGIWTFNPLGGQGGIGWDAISDGWVFGGLKAGRQVNHVEVTVQTTATNTSILVSINGARRNFDVKNSRMFDSSGPVGLIVGMHSLEVAFDNFYFEELEP